MCLKNITLTSHVGIFTSFACDKIVLFSGQNLTNTCKKAEVDIKNIKHSFDKIG